MEEELILQQPADRRIGNASDLPPGPPGAEFDADEFNSKKPSKVAEKESASNAKSSRRRSLSASPAPASRRKSISRSPPPRRSGGRDRERYRGGRGHSPTPPRRNRFRDYSPDRDRRRVGMRRSPDRDRRRSRSPPPRRGGRDRDRYRGGRGRSISRSRSISPIRGGGGAGSRWSPKKKPHSPAGNNNMVSGLPSGSNAPPSYGVIPPQLYGNETYGAAAGVPYTHQYSVPPPQTPFSQPPSAYSAPPPAFNAGFPPPNAWGVNESYGPQAWMQPSIPDVSQQLPPQMQPVISSPVSAQPQQMTTMAGPTPQQNMNVLADAAPGTVDPNPAHDAVAQEAENQRDELKKQRSSYQKKTAVLKRELKMLKEQRKDLHAGGEPPSPTTNGFINENEKLQNQIQKKLSTIENVIDMLTGIIGEENLDKDDMEQDEELRSVAAPSHGHEGMSQEGPHQPSEGLKQKRDQEGGNGRSSSAERRSKKKKKRKVSTSSTESSSGDESSTSESSSTSQSSSSSDEDERDTEKKMAVKKLSHVIGAAADDDTSSERLKHRAMESMRSKQNTRKNEPSSSKVKEERIADDRPRFNYVFYDPEMHWCQTCDAFPKTAKDYLNHLHTKEHINREDIETPWHMEMTNDQYPVYENVPTKRTPIRGLTFFVPATAWYCKLCKVWMGDLHCASTHLKSQLHSNKYNSFLEQNPHFEVNWLADRQRVLNEQKATPLPPQITSVSTTGERSHGGKKSAKKDPDAKPKEKKHKKKSSADRKEKKAAAKKKKKQRSKKRKRTSSSSSSSTSNSSNSESEVPSKKAKAPVVVPDLQNANPEVSVRATMRRQETENPEALPPPPPQISAAANANANAEVEAASEMGKWTTTAGEKKAAAVQPPTVQEVESRRDEAIIQQWNTVQPVISESEKKLLEQLKGKLKNKVREEQTKPAVAGGSDSAKRPAAAAPTAKPEAESDRRRRSRSPVRGGRDGGGRDGGNNRDVSARDGGGRDTGGGGGGGMRRSHSRGRSRSRSRVGGGGGGGGGGFRGGWGNRRRMRSRSRGRRSRSFGRRRRSRSLRRRSRSPDRRRRSSRSKSRSWSRSRSKSRGRMVVEKAVVKHSEFRPRVPEREPEKPKKSGDSSKDKKKSSSSSTTSGSAAKSSSASSNQGSSSKKLPFIGKMPVFKKQTSGAGGTAGDERRCDEPMNMQMGTATGYSMAPMRIAPTAAQIQMAMMEDAYGNAPPFHPDAGMMPMDYDDLMPDPMQFVNLMGQAPPPPPPPPSSNDANANADGSAEGVVVVAGSADVDDTLPPGIDEAESEEFMPKPMAADASGKGGALPKDLEEALNIIFPGEKKDDDEDEETKARRLKAAASGQTHIIIEEPVMQADDLVKQGIHMVTMEETASAVVAMDEASQMSMNEPLVFNKPAGNGCGGTPPAPSNVTQENSSPAVEEKSTAPLTSQAMPTFAALATNGSPAETQQAADKQMPLAAPEPTEIPMPQNEPVPAKVAAAAAIPVPADPDLALAAVYDLDDIPQPPDEDASLNDEGKQRRQEELDDLAMLGIDEDDMAAQCI